jgi:adenylylsulfate kinase
MKETHKRTVVRMITYRLTAWLLTVPFTYWMTGDWESAFGSSAVLHVLLTADYYVHERVWLRIKWGRE